MHDPYAEIWRLRDRVEELEHLFGLTAFFPPHMFGLTPTEARVLGVLVRREFVAREALHAALYGGRADCDVPALRAVDMHVHTLRLKLRRLGYCVHSKLGSGGWWLDRPTRAALQAWLVERTKEAA